MKQCTEAAREGEEKPFGSYDLSGAAPEKPNEQLWRQEHKKTAGTPLLRNKMLDLMEGYLDNFAAAATQTAANGGPLAEFVASLAISVNIIARQQQ